MESIKLITIPNAFDRSNRDLSYIEYHNESLLDIRNSYFPLDVDVVVSINGTVIPKEKLDNTYIEKGQEILFVPNILGGGDGGGKAILSALVMIAVAVAIPWAVGYLGANVGSLGWLVAGSKLSTAGMLVAGAGIMGAGMLVNALLPHPAMVQDAQQNTAQGYGWNPQTVCEQGRVIPKYYGTFKLYGNIINSFISNQKDQQYLSSLISLGAGPFTDLSGDISSMEVNDLPLEDRYHITPEVRNGYVTQTMIEDFSNTKSLESMNERFCNVQNYITARYQVGQLCREGTDDDTAMIYSCIKEPATAGTVTPSPTSDPTYWALQGPYKMVWDMGMTGYSTYEIDISAPYGCYTVLNNVITPATLHIYMEYKEDSDSTWTAIPGDGGEAYALTVKGAMSKPVRYTKTITGLSEDGVYYFRMWRKEKSGMREIQTADVSYQTFLTGIRKVVPDDFTYPRHALVGFKALAVSNLSGEFNFSVVARCSKVAVYTTSTAYTIAYSSNPAWVMWDVITQPVIDSIGGVDTIVRYDGRHPSTLDFVKFKELADWCDEIITEGSNPASVVSHNGVVYTALLDHLSNDNNKPPNTTYWTEGDSIGIVQYDESLLQEDNKCSYSSTNAWLDFDHENFTSYASKTPAYKVVMTDSYGKTATGYLGAAISSGGGESLGPNLVTNGTFDSNIDNWRRIGESAFFTHSSGTMRVAGGSTVFDAPAQLYDAIPRPLQTTAQAISGGDYTTYNGKEKAFDGFLDSMWGSLQTTGHSGVSYIGQNYGKRTTITTLRITHYTQTQAMPVFKLQYSNDGSTWTDIQTYTDLDPSALTKEITVTSYPGGNYFRILAMYNIGTVGVGLRWWVKEIETIGIQEYTQPPGPVPTTTKYFYQPLSLVRNTLYKVSVDIPATSAAVVRQFVGPNFNNPATAVATTGLRGAGTNIVSYFTYTGTDAYYISHEDSNANGGYSTWDNISVQAVNTGAATSSGVLVYRNATKTVGGWIEEAGFNRNSPSMQVTITSQGSSNANAWKVGEFYYGSASSTNTRISFHGGFEEGTTVWEAVMDICQLARCVPIWKGTTLSLAIDKVSTPVQTFSMGNIIKDSFKLNYLSKEERASEIEIDYIDRELGYDRTKLIVFDHDLPNQTSKASLNLKGITSKHLALRSGLYRLYCNKYLIRHATWDADVDAIACTVGDRVYVENDVPVWNISGRIASVLSTSSVTLDRAITVSGTCKLMVTLTDSSAGQVIEERTISNAAGTYAAGTAINVTAPFTYTPKAFDVYYAGALDKHIYTITSIKKNGNMTVNLEGLQYDARVYDCDNYSMYNLPTN